MAIVACHITAKYVLCQKYILARTALRTTLRANAECAHIGFHLYCFPFCHLLILCMLVIQASTPAVPADL